MIGRILRAGCAFVLGLIVGLTVLISIITR